MPETSPKTSQLRRAIWGAGSTKIRKSAQLRRPAIAAYQLVARVALTGPPPKIFANSMPKAGTHLLTQLLGNVPKVWFCGIHVISKDFSLDASAPGDRAGAFVASAFEKRMRGIRNGQFLTAHMPVRDGVEDVLARNGFVHLLMIRDPRDMVVSRAFYQAANQRLVTHEQFARLEDDDARLMAAITGLPSRDGMPAVPPIADRLREYRPWLANPSVCVIRFEDLVGAAGGGSADAQQAAVRRILETCHRDSSDASVARLAEQVFARHSATFRNGTIGDWRNHLTERHLEALHSAAPDALAAYGYE